MVVALLVIAAANGVMGLFTTDDIIVYGPMTSTVSERTVKIFSALHQKTFVVFLALIGLHVLANVLYSRFGKDNLIRAMITGKKPASTFVDRAPATPGSIIVALICLIVAVVIVLGSIKLGGGRFP